MANVQTIHRVLDLVDPSSHDLLDLSVDEARSRLFDPDPETVLGIRGSFALVARDGDRVALARSLDRPLRFFLAKEPQGPMLIVAERIDQIQACLDEHGYGHQFHPSYSRMVPAFHVTMLQLVGCPDPAPEQRRFFTPDLATLPADLDTIGEQYVGAILDEVGAWLDHVPADEPLGVLFSGGLDSGSVLLAMHHQLLARGASPARLKAFTLAVEGEGGDLDQAREFLRRLDLEMLGEVIDVPASAVDPFAAVEVIEDYKPLDVECAAVNLALLGGVRERYPDWTLIVDGDGGDENLKDYPIEENPELSIVSVVTNRMLYQEGWGVDALKHSSVYSGGQSRGCVRGWAPARKFGFRPFSPLTRPSVIQVAEAIPFDELTGGDHERLYALKGEVYRRGFAKHLGIELPVFPKRRFQDGAGADALRARLGHTQATYRAHFAALHPGP